MVLVKMCFNEVCVCAYVLGSVCVGASPLGGLHDQKPLRHAQAGGCMHVYGHVWCLFVCLFVCLHPSVVYKLGQLTF